MATPPAKITGKTAKRGRDRRVEIGPADPDRYADADAKADHRSTAPSAAASAAKNP